MSPSVVTMHDYLVWMRESITGLQIAFVINVAQLSGFKWKLSVLL